MSGGAPGAPITRRGALFTLAAATVGCGGAPRGERDKPPPPPLKLAPISDLCPAAGLSWLVVAAPKAIVSAPELTLAMGELLKASRFEDFQKRYGVDLRSQDEIVVAGYGASTLALTRGFLDPAAVERAFATRAIVDERRVAASGIVEIDGRVGVRRERLIVFGVRGAGLERAEGDTPSRGPTPIRAARLFAEERLHRAKPALASEPLQSARVALGDGYGLSAFFAGPFDGEWARGAGGLLRVATAASLGIRALAGSEPGGRLEIVIALLGRFDDEAAKSRFGATIDRVLASDIGRLVATDQPVEPLRVDTTPYGLRARVVVRALPFFRGLYAATDASAEELFGR